MNKYCLFFDIDGTILDTMRGLKKPSDSFIKALNQLRENGHLCYIASGRPYSQLSEELKELPFDGLILCNGALVFENNEVILSHVFQKDFIKEITSYFDKLNSPYTLVTFKKSYLPKKYEKSYVHLRLFSIPTGEAVDELDLEQLDVVKIETTRTKRKAVEYIKQLKNEGYVIHGYDMFSTYEINMPHVSKANSILEVLKLHQIPVENSIAFGDGENDIEMLRCVGIGIAMNNASKEVKMAADRITESCSHDGVVRELQRMGLVHKIIY